MLTHKERLARKRRLARLLIRRGIAPGEAHTQVGFMLNRAPWLAVEGAVRASIGDTDPIAGALELLAKEAGNGW